MKFFKVLFVTFLATICFYLKGISQTASVEDSLLNKAIALKFSNQDSAYAHLNRGYKLRLKEGDTLRAINFLTELSFLHAHNTNYEKAYDGYWQAQLLADKSNDSISKANVFLGLGWLYTFYKRNDEAFKYLDRSLKLRKHEVQKGNMHIEFLTENYFSLASFYRVNKEFETAKVYLDSIIFLQKEKGVPKDYYSLSESGYLAAIDGKISEGLNQLNESIDFFKNANPSYLVVPYALLGNIHRTTGNFASSETFFTKSLEESRKHNSHLDYRLFVFEELYKLYSQNGKFEKANEFLEKAKDLNEKIYSVKNNQHLFEIKDKFRIEQKRLEDLANQQRILQLEQEDRVWMLKSIILVVTIVFILLFAYLLIRHIRNKHKNEKLIIRERQKERLKRHQEVLELKNKELTESALRLIEKDEFIASIKTRLANQKDHIDANIVNRILKSIQGTPQSNWSEFEARFTAINQSFYKELKARFPNLKQSDLKICALVKLNFPSKDMAKLLGISVESVHTSRHRLRKKLSLTRNDNLEEFINSF